jgi:hypothetical protein
MDGEMIWPGRPAVKWDQLAAWRAEWEYAAEQSRLNIIEGIAGLGDIHERVVAKAYDIEVDDVREIRASLARIEDAKAALREAANEAIRARAMDKWYDKRKFRPVDMGGPRDVWMTFSPGPDHRIDVMEPVRV